MAENVYSSARVLKDDKKVDRSKQQKTLEEAKHGDVIEGNGLRFRKKTEGWDSLWVSENGLGYQRDDSVKKLVGENYKFVNQKDNDNLNPLKIHFDKQAVNSKNWNINHKIEKIKDRADEYEIITHVNGKRGIPSNAQRQVINNKPTLPKEFEFIDENPYYSNSEVKMTEESIENYGNHNYTDSEFSGSGVWKVRKR